LKKVTLPDGVTSIGEYAFQQCSSLTELVLPDGVTSIGKYAFDGCRSLTEIKIPSSVTSIENNAFSGSNKLTTVNLGCTSTLEVDSSDFYGARNVSTVNYIHPDDVESNNGFCDACIYQKADFDKATNTYEIHNAGQLYWFAGLVNGTLADGTAQNKAANAVLIKDITVNQNVLNSDGELNGASDDYLLWPMIGTGGYSGTFDGNGKTVSGLVTEWIDQDTENKVGMFYSISAGGKVCDLTLSDSYMQSWTSTGGIAYENYGTVSGCKFYGTANNNKNIAAGIVVENRAGGIVENCEMYGKLITSAQKGGIVSNNTGSISGCINHSSFAGYSIGGIASNNSGTIENCINEGNIGSEGAYGIGGLVFIQQTTGTVKNSYSIGSVLGYGAGVLVGNNSGTVTNCYYQADAASGTIGTNKTAAEFASGEVAYLLNGSTSEGDLTWFQTCGTGYPMFEGDIVYQVKDCAGGKSYSNTDEEVRTHEGGVASCTEKATCEVCGEKYGELDATNHGEKEVKNIVEATCTEKGYTGDTCCADCGTVLEAGEAIEAKGHVGGAGTCTEKPTCEVCGEKYGELDATNHGEKEVKNIVEATCTEKGYTGDTCCKDCGTVLEAGEAIEAKGHVGGAGTCTEKATCEVCGEKYGELDATNHGEKEVKNIVEATCTAEGYTGDTCCKDCGAVLEQGKAIEATGHVGGTATCTEKATCEVCGEKYNEVDNTKHGDTELKNVTEATCTENGYTGDTCCKDCGAVLEQGKAIEAKGHVGGTATCTEKATCEVCGEKYNEVNATNHGEKEVRNQVEATCTETGYTGDTCCKDCGYVFASGETIAAKGHVYTSAVTKEPTVTETGVLTYTCANCGDTYTEVIEKLPNPAQGVEAEVTYATHWGNGGQVEITLTNGGEDLIGGWNVELDLNITGELTNSWGDGYVTSFKDGHVTIKNQDWAQNFEAGNTKKVYLQYNGTLPGFVTCTQNGDALVASINYLNHWGNGGQIEILLENTGAALADGWGTELTINLTGKMAGTWGDGFVTSYENGHIVIKNQDWVKGFETGTKKSVWLQFDGILPVEATGVVTR